MVALIHGYFPRISRTIAGSHAATNGASTKQKLSVKRDDLAVHHRLVDLHPQARRPDPP